MTDRRLADLDYVLREILRAADGLRALGEIASRHPEVLLPLPDVTDPDELLRLGDKISGRLHAARIYAVRRGVADYVEAWNRCQEPEGAYTVMTYHGHK